MLAMKTINNPQSQRNQRKLRRDLKTLALFTSIYCRNHHHGAKNTLAPKELPITVPELEHYRYCTDCQELLTYAIDRRLRCPLNPKPACRDCPHNCYAEPQRTMIRKIMAFAGPYLIKRGRFDLLWRLYFG